jgi:hypothetical protein
VDHGFLGFEFAADEFVRRGDAHRLLHLRHRLQRIETRAGVADADGSDHDPLLALDRVDLVTELLNALGHFVDFRSRRMAPHRNNHDYQASSLWPNSRAPRRRPSRMGFSSRARAL